VSLNSLVHQRFDHPRLANRVREPDGPVSAPAVTTVVDDGTAFPAGSMRLLEGFMAVAAIATALLIGIR
jgi:hypothetical protein